MTTKDIKALSEINDDLDLSQIIQVYCGEPKELLDILAVVSTKLSRYHGRVCMAKGIINERASYLESYLSGKMYDDEPIGKYAEKQREHASRIREVLSLLENKRIKRGE